jgi:hypothetical protein
MLYVGSLHQLGQKYTQHAHTIHIWLNIKSTIAKAFSTLEGIYWQRVNSKDN